jgi:hypothetical protein
VISWLRGLRGDLRLARRPAYLIVVVGVALLAGLGSAMMQDTIYQQLQNARGSVRLGCGGASSSSDCTAQQRARRTFLAAQQREAGRLAALQTPEGAATYAGRTLGLGLGAAVVVLLASMLVSMEASRGTLGLALVGRWTAGGVAVRRWCAIALLMLGPLAAAWLGSWIAGSWGARARPLPDATVGFEAVSLAGMAVLVAVYAAVASLAAWLSRKPVQTLFVGGVAIALLAMTSSVAAWLPGAAAPGVLGLDSVLEFEVGYLWVWPALSFPNGVGEAVHHVDTLAWAPSAGVLAILGCAALAGAAAAANAQPRV